MIFVTNQVTNTLNIRGNTIIDGNYGAGGTVPAISISGPAGYLLVGNSLTQASAFSHSVAFNSLAGVCSQNQWNGKGFLTATNASGSLLVPSNAS